MASSGDNATRECPAESSGAVAGGSTRDTSVESDANRPATGLPVRPSSSRSISNWIALYFCIRRVTRRILDSRLRLKDLFATSEPLMASLLPRASPWGAIGGPVTRPVATLLLLPACGLNPRANKFKPKRSKAFKPVCNVLLPAPPPPGLNVNAPEFHPPAPPPLGLDVDAPVFYMPAPPSLGLNINAPVFHWPGSDILELHVLSQFPEYKVRRCLHNNNHPEWSRMLKRVQRQYPHAIGAIQQFAELEKQRYKVED